LRVRALIVVLWRAALRIQEALALTETDVDANRCSVLVQHGKGGHRREVGIDMWAWNALRPWLRKRTQLPVGPLFCVIDGPTRGARAWSSAAVRAQFRRLAADAAHRASRGSSSRPGGRCPATASGAAAGERWKTRVPRGAPPARTRQRSVA
jgi:site-specific recombinase XerC